MSAKPNVYTVLVFVAFVALAVGIGFTWHANTQMTGQSNPMYIVPAPTGGD